MKKAIGLALAVLATSVVAASAQGSQTAAARCSGQLQLHEDDHAAVRHPAHRRRRLPRRRADELGEVRGQDARPSRSG